VWQFALISALQSKQTIDQLSCVGPRWTSLACFESCEKRKSVISPGRAAISAAALHLAAIL